MNFVTSDNVWILIAIAAWSLPWKGVALWRAAKKDDKNWFIAILIVNSLAILDIIYIFIVSKRKSLEKLPMKFEEKI